MIERKCSTCKWWDHNNIILAEDSNEGFDLSVCLYELPASCDHDICLMASISGKDCLRWEEKE